jgi:prepilin-type N-terminal cleavage/methylation domain-containing protein
MTLSPTSNRAYSLVEMLITVAVIGILAAIAVPSIGSVVEGSRRGVANNVISTLNNATREFGHSQWSITTAPTTNSGADEFYILRTLQWRDPDTSGELNPKGPFMRPDWNPVTSSSADDYRAEWTGSSWRLLEPKTSGSGIKIDFDGSDLGTIYTHDPSFIPAGAL